MSGISLTHNTCSSGIGYAVAGGGSPANASPALLSEPSLFLTVIDLDQ